MTPRPITSAPIVSTPSLSHSTALTTVSSTPPVPGGGTMACSLRSKRCPPLLLHTGAIISRMSNRLAYKIVVRHFLDEDKTIKHTEQCTDIVYMIETGYGVFPKAFSTCEEAQAQLEELNNTRN